MTASAAKSFTARRPLVVARRWLAALGATVLFGASAAFAQGQPVVTLAASPAERCLAPVEGQRTLPVYPAELLRLKQASVVNIELVFDAPDRAPKLRFTGPEPSDDFRASIETYAQQLRVPCMVSGAGPVTLRQRFDFEPNDGRKVAWTAPADVADKVRQEALKCLAHPSGDDAQIRYPEDMLRQGRQQAVIARMRFTAADSGPSSEVLFDGGHRSFDKAVAGYLKGMRLPCLPAGTTVDTLIKFQFQLSDVSRQVQVLKDLDLRDFLGAVKRAPGDSVYFDTVPMKCRPFDVRLTIGEPFGPNTVELLEDDEAARRPLADWIARQTFGLAPDVAAEVNGQPMNIHIPCARIDL